MTEPVEQKMEALRIAVVTVSDTRTLADDKSGQALLDFVMSSGHILAGRVIIADDRETITETVKSLMDQAQVVLLTGGTGITSRDVTPEAIAPLLTKSIDGFGELFRMLSYQDIGAATIQSRAIGALCGKTLVFALPGSTGAVKLAIDKILASQLDSRTKPCNFAQLLARV